MNRFKISLLLSLPLFYAPLEANTHHAKYIKLGEHNEIVKKSLETLDGTIINGAIFAIMFDVRNKIHAVLVGDRDNKNSNRRTGRYVFQGKNYSVQELAMIEPDYVGDTELNIVLAQAKNDFEVMMAQFIHHARGSQDLLEKLIQESCYRRNRHDSILLTWGSCKDGQETVIFHTQIQSFKTLAEFCQDLEHYLEDLMFSCEKAQELYIKAKNKHDQNKQ